MKQTERNRIRISKRFSTSSLMAEIVLMIVIYGLVNRNETLEDFE